MRTTQIIDDEASLGVLLQCPRCGADVEELDCPLCALHLRISNGIVHAVPSERIAHYARFIEEYERIRAAEGRGSESGEFYLSLPYKDTSGRNSEQWKIRARSYDYLVDHILRPHLQADRRRVLDIGAGNCWMSFRLRLAGYYPIAVDLLTNDRDGLGAAEHYRQHLPEIFPRFQAELAQLPFQDEQFDAVIFNASFHYAEESEAAIREALRCVTEDGLVIICDTPWYSREESGLQMVSERRSEFLRRYDTASDSLRAVEYLTDSRLQALEDRLSIKWSIHRPRYGFKWAMRPFVAKLRNRREPSRFHIYVAQKSSS
jgi:SAM-dependent methyltransferase